VEFVVRDLENAAQAACAVTYGELELAIPGLAAVLGQSCCDGLVLKPLPADAATRVHHTASPPAAVIAYWRAERVTAELGVARQPRLE
jgi:hypothetical protein